MIGRLNWLGHMMRLPNETPARRVLEEALRPTQHKQGRRQLTWLKVIEKDLTPPITQLNLNTETVEKIIEKLEEVTVDRIRWSNYVKNIMEINL